VGFIIAAHDTTSTTITWTLKFLADHQDVQNKLRSTLHSSFANAKIENRQPSYQEITKTVIPYLDAVIEESIRYSRTTPSAIRTALNDVEVLGHRIPKGTDVFLMSNGPSIFSPSFPISDTLRSPTALAAKERVGAWDPDDMGEFKPERWLKEEDGEMVFDAAAGPLLTFGLGPRGCYGRRLAYLKLRLLLVLVVWELELGRVPEGLRGYEAVDKLTHMPQQCYVRLRKL
jgi:cytochrome P450